MNVVLNKRCFKLYRHALNIMDMIRYNKHALNIIGMIKYNRKKYNKYD